MRGHKENEKMQEEVMPGGAGLGGARRGVAR